MAAPNYLSKLLASYPGKQLHLAKKLGVDERTVRNWKSEKTKPTRLELARIGDVFGYAHDEIEQLLGLVEPANLVRHTTRVIDLRRASIRRPSQHVRVHCHYSFSMLAPPYILQFFGATGGSKVSIDHDSASEVVSNTISNGPCPDREHKLQAKIEYDCSELKKNWFDVSYTINYYDAFLNSPDHWFHTHIDYPTKHLQLLVLFADDAPPGEISLHQTQTASRNSDLIPSAIRPSFLRRKTMASFSIKNPGQGFTYQVNWQW